MSILVVKNNAQIEAEEAAKTALEEEQNKPVIGQLASYVRRCWDSARNAKQDINTAMKKSLNQYKGEYEAEDLKIIQESGLSTIFMKLTAEKCEALKSWMDDMLLQQADKPWGVWASPVPEINPEQQEYIRRGLEARLWADMQSGLITQDEFDQFVKDTEDKLMAEAKKLAKIQDAKLEEHLDDILTEGGFYKAMREMLHDITIYKNGFIKGPVVRMRPRLKWVNGALSISDELSKEFERVSPLDIYPSPNSTEIGDSYIIEHHRLSRSDLYALIGVEGYSEEAIRDVLRRHKDGNSGLSSWLTNTVVTNTENSEINSEANSDPDAKIDALQFWGKISGNLLIEYGYEGEIEDPDADYDMEVWLISDKVIRAEINPDALGRPPYATTSFRKIPGSFWGESLAEVLSDIQKVINALARAIINNTGFASGPQVGVDMSRIAEGESITNIYPMKIWQFKDSVGGRPIDFFVPPFVADALLRVYEFFSSQADSVSGIPKYSYGTGSTSGALRTATGYSMMLSNATRGVKSVAGNIDSDITENTITRLFHWLAVYEPFDWYRGDAYIVAKGSKALVVKEQTQLRRQELLGLMLNPAVMNITKPEGLAELLRKILDGADMHSEDIIPSKEELIKQARILEMQMQSNPQAMPVPAGGEAVNPAGQRMGGQDFGVV